VIKLEEEDVAKIQAELPSLNKDVKGVQRKFNQCVRIWRQNRINLDVSYDSSIATFCIVVDVLL